MAWSAQPRRSPPAGVRCYSGVHPRSVRRLASYPSPGLRSDHLRCAGLSESGVGGVSEAFPIAQGSLAMSVIRFLAKIVTAIAALAEHRAGRSAWE